MAISDYQITLCVSSRLHRIEDVAHCIAASPVRVSAAGPSRDDNRAFWYFEQKAGEGFDDALSRAVNWACGYAELLSPIEDASLLLWCEVHSETEFAGLAFQSADMMRLGQCGMDLLVSVYAEQEGAAK